MNLTLLPDFLKACPKISCLCSNLLTPTFLVAIFLIFIANHTYSKETQYPHMDNPLHIPVKTVLPPRPPGRSPGEPQEEPSDLHIQTKFKDGSSSSDIVLPKDLYTHIFEGTHTKTASILKSMPLSITFQILNASKQTNYGIMIITDAHSLRQERYKGRWISDIATYQGISIDKEENGNEENGTAFRVTDDFAKVTIELFLGPDVFDSQPDIKVALAIRDDENVGRSPCHTQERTCGNVATIKVAPMDRSEYFMGHNVFFDSTKPAGQKGFYCRTCLFHCANRITESYIIYGDQDGALIGDWRRLSTKICPDTFANNETAQFIISQYRERPTLDNEDTVDELFIDIAENQFVGIIPWDESFISHIKTNEDKYTYLADEMMLYFGFGMLEHGDFERKIAEFRANALDRLKFIVGYESTQEITSGSRQNRSLCNLNIRVVDHWKHQSIFLQESLEMEPEFVACNNSNVPDKQISVPRNRYVHVYIARSDAMTFKLPLHCKTESVNLYINAGDHTYWITEPGESWHSVDRKQVERPSRPDPRPECGK